MCEDSGAQWCRVDCVQSRKPGPADIRGLQYGAIRLMVGLTVCKRTEKILFMNVLKEYKVSLKNCLEKPSMDTLPPHPKSSFTPKNLTLESLG